MSPVTRRGALSLIPAAVASVATPVATLAAVQRDPLLETITHKRSLDAAWNDPSIEEDSPEWMAREAEEQATWLALCQSGPATTLVGAIAALELALDDMGIGPGPLAPAMIRSALDFLRREA